jgi:hypothetical protein
MKKKLKALSASQLAEWLTLETMTTSGVNLLCSHLMRLSAGASGTDYARALLRSAISSSLREQMISLLG